MVCEAIYIGSLSRKTLSNMSEKILSFAMLSDPGRVRSHNEDTCAANAELGVFVVCDGVGGAASGEVASELAAQSFLNLVAAAREDQSPSEDGISAGVEYANQAVYHKSRSAAALRGMATTLVALVFTPVAECSSSAAPDSAGTVWIANIGDSRCYRLRAGAFNQLTRDHSVVEEQVRAGVITREQAEVSPIRNVITRAVGSDSAVDADIECLAARHGDLFLLCSDGLIRDLTDAEIAAILLAAPAATDDSLAGLCSQLIAAANAKGGGDNITCILVHIA
jgi:protein phosphatase